MIKKFYILLFTTQIMNAIFDQHQIQNTQKEQQKMEHLRKAVRLTEIISARFISK